MAGGGRLPYIAARNALARGETVRIFPFTKEEVPDDLQTFCEPVVLTKFFSSMVRTVCKSGVKRLLLLGKASRDILYGEGKFDLRTLWMLARMPDQNDTTFFRETLSIFAERGVEILPQTDYLENLFLQPGRYGPRLSRQELMDISYGMEYARQVNRLDIGQSVVVGRKCVLAVECAEGTNECIRRGGRLFHHRGAVVCKVAKIDHDTRFDIPVTGEATLEAMGESGCRVLAIEAAKTFVLDPTAFVNIARNSGISIMAVNPEESDLKTLRKLNRLTPEVASK